MIARICRPLGQAQLEEQKTGIPADFAAVCLDQPSLVDNALTQALI